MKLFYNKLFFKFKFSNILNLFHFATIYEHCPIHLCCRVVKTNVTRPICIRRHVNIHLDVSIASIKTNAKNSLVTLGATPITIGDWNWISITYLVMTKNIWSLSLQWLKIFSRHLFGVSLWPCHLHEKIS